MLNIDDIVDGEIVNGEWEGTKTLDKLLSVFNANIEAQRDSSRITDSEYGQLYVSGLIEIMKQSIDFEDRKLMNDAQIRSIDKDIEIKERGMIENELSGAKQRDAIDAEINYKVKQSELIDSQIIGSGYDNQVKKEQVTMSIFEREFIQPKNLEKISRDIDLTNEQIKLTYAERIIKDKEASLLGLDKVLQTVGANPENVYTIKYNM